METTDARRLESIDLVRGLVMVIMLLDHTRDFTHASGALWDPLDAARTHRQETHFRDIQRRIGVPEGPR